MEPVEYLTRRGITEEHHCDLERWGRERANLERRLADARSAVEEVGQRGDEEAERLEAALTAERGQTEKLRCKLVGLRARLRGYETSHQELLERAERAENTNDEVRDLLAEQTVQTHRLKFQRSLLEEDLEVARQRYGSCECELADTRLELSAAQDRIANQQQTIHNLLAHVGGPEQTPEPPEVEQQEGWDAEQLEHFEEVLAQTDESETAEVGAASAMSVCSSSDEEEEDDDDLDRPSYRSSTPRGPPNFDQMVDDAMAFHVEESDEDSDYDYLMDGVSPNPIDVMITG